MKRRNGDSRPFYCASRRPVDSIARLDTLHTLMQASSASGQLITSRFAAAITPLLPVSLHSLAPLHNPPVDLKRHLHTQHGGPRQGERTRPGKVCRQEYSCQACRRTGR